MSQLDKSETVECQAGVELANQILFQWCRLGQSPLEVSEFWHVLVLIPQTITMTSTFGLCCLVSACMVVDVHVLSS